MKEIKKDLRNVGWDRFAVNRATRHALKEVKKQDTTLEQLDQKITEESKETPAETKDELAQAWEEVDKLDKK